MSSPGSLLVIGGRPAHLQKAKALGLDIVYCQFKDQFEGQYGEAELVEGAILMDYTDWKTLRPLVQAAYEAWPFSAVTPLTHTALEPAARTRDMLGLDGTSYEVTHRFTNKYCMRRRLEAYGADRIRPVRAELADNAESIIRFGAKCGYPFILKPTNMTASYGLVRVPDDKSASRAWEKIMSLRDGPPEAPLHGHALDTFIMEEYINGPEYSVEAFSFGGRHIVIAITEATVLENFVHVGHAIPARLSLDDENAIVSLVTSFLDAMGFRDGPTHTEVKLSQGEPVIIESQNRTGGGQIPEMISIVYGIDLIALTIGWPFRLCRELPDRPKPRRAAASALLIAEPGIIDAIDGLDEVHGDPAIMGIDLRAAPGDLVRPLSGSWDGLGHVVATGSATSEAIAACQRNLARIKVSTHPVS